MAAVRQIKLLKGIVLIIMFFILLTKAGEIKLARDPTICTGSGIQTLLNSAQAVSQPTLATPVTVQLSKSSRILCASQAHTKGAQGFDFDNGICRFYEPDQRVLGGNNDSYYTPFSFPPIGDLEEVARGKMTYSSPSLSTRKRHEAVDGLLGDQDMYHSTTIAYPWWIVDIGEFKTIYQVQVLSRLHCCSDRFRDIEIRVGTILRTDGDLTSYTLMSTYKGPYAKAEGYLICSRYDGIVGRYISIQRPTSTDFALQLLEVNVFAK